MSTVSLFRSACESCTKAKTRCDGKNPCGMCEKKKIQCMYSFKKKRGPRQTSSPKRQKTHNSPNLMSSYERRLWEVFFIIFRNARHSENKYSWCWLARQLKKLDGYVRSPLGDVTKTERIAQLLDSFLDSLDLTKTGLESTYETACPYSPEVCSSCSSIVISPSDSGAPCEDTYPEATDVMWRWGADKYQTVFDSDQMPCFVYESRNGSYGAFVNPSFQRHFAFDNQGFNDLLGWSGGGFLPWAGDLIAALMVHQQDLLLFLQILAFKYQATGLHSKQSEFHKNMKKGGKKISEEWKVPSCHCFYLWARPNDEVTEKPAQFSELKQCSVNFSCVVRMRQEGGTMCMRIEFMAHDIGPAEVLGDGRRVTHEKPLVDVDHSKKSRIDPHDWETVVKTLSAGASAEESASASVPPSAASTIVQDTQDSYIQTCKLDHLPINLKKEYESWSFPHFSVHSNREGHSSSSEAQNAEEEFSLTPDIIGDEEWLKDLIEFANEA